MRKISSSSRSVTTSTNPLFHVVENSGVCVYIMARWKDIIHDLREATVATYQSGEGYKDISKLN